jgi:hypothetical protein
VPVSDGDRPYSRVTNPERYAPLVHAANRAIADLTDRFDITVEQVAPTEIPNDLVVRATRLYPAGGGADITVTETTFPGIVLAFGTRGEDQFPRCGCDACDEDVDRLVEELLAHLEAIAAGGLSESPRGFEVRFPDGGVSASEKPQARPLPARDYPPWRRRRR